MTRKDEKKEKKKVQTAGFEPASANTLRPERSPLDLSGRFALQFTNEFRYMTQNIIKPNLLF